MAGFSARVATAAHYAATSHGIAVVGGGYRGTTFLTSIPGVASQNAVIVEGGHEIGPGAFADLTGLSNSAARSFFRHATTEFKQDASLRMLAKMDDPIDLARLADGLRTLAAGIPRVCGASSVMTGDPIIAVYADSGESPVILRSASGRLLKAEFCVLATGRQELADPRLHALAGPTLWLSSRVLSRGSAVELQRAVARAGSRDIAIVGGSHSAFGVLARLLETSKAIGGGASPTVTVYHRRAVRVQYPSLEHACRSRISSVEQRADAKRHVCPETGIVFRDSGLRHGAATLFREIVAGRVPRVRLQRTRSLDEFEGQIARAALVIQATGYKARHPDVFVGDNGLWKRLSRPRVDERGALFERNLRRVPRVAALRLGPTPRMLRDATAYGTGLYGVLRSRLRSIRAGPKGDSVG